MSTTVKILFIILISLFILGLFIISLKFILKNIILDQKRIRNNLKFKNYQKKKSQRNCGRRKS